MHSVKISYIVFEITPRSFVLFPLCWEQLLNMLTAMPIRSPMQVRHIYICSPFVGGLEHLSGNSPAGIAQKTRFDITQLTSSIEFQKKRIIFVKNYEQNWILRIKYLISYTGQKSAFSMAWTSANAFDCRPARQIQPKNQALGCKMQNLFALWRWISKSFIFIVLSFSFISNKIV